MLKTCQKKVAQEERERSVCEEREGQTGGVSGRVHPFPPKTVDTKTHDQVKAFRKQCL